MKRSHIYQGKQWRTTGDRCVGKRRMHIRNMMIKHEQSGYPATVHISKEFLLGMAKILFWMVWGYMVPLFSKTPTDPPWPPRHLPIQALLQRHRGRPAFHRDLGRLAGGFPETAAAAFLGVEDTAESLQPGNGWKKMSKSIGNQWWTHYSCILANIYIYIFKIHI